MFDGGTDASMFGALDGYDSVASYSSESNTVRTEEEQMNKGKDSFFCDLPDLSSFDDFGTSMRNFNPTFEIGADYFDDDTLWSSVCSPDSQLVPSSSLDSINVSSVPNQSATATLFESSVSVPDQNNVTHSTNIQQQTKNDGRNHAPLIFEAHAIPSCGEIDQFSRYIDAELFGPFVDPNIARAKQTGGYEGLEAMVCSNHKTQVPAASSTMLPAESVVTSSTCSGPDLVAPCSKRKLNDPLHGAAPDMLLEGMAENPLEMYFPPLITLEQPQVLMSATSTQTCQELAAGSTSALNCASGMQLCSKEMSSAELQHEQPRSTLILEAVPVKDLGFHKLQNGMNQMDVATKGRIRDALYRLANSVEQRHYVAGSSSSQRFIPGRWTETQTNPMDQSVAQLLLQKPPYRNTVSSSRVT